MISTRKTALLITRNLPPVFGGMERLIGHVAEALCTHYEVVVVGPHGARLPAQPAAFYGSPLSPLPRFLVGAALQARKAAKHHRPDFVFAGSGLTAPFARMAARKADAPYAVYLHGLDIATPQPIYRRLFVPAIRRADLVIANSHYTAGLAELAGVPGRRIRILHPGVELPIAIPERDHAAAGFRQHYGLPDGPILLGVGRLTSRKGFANFVANSLPAIIQTIPEAQFVLAGEVPRHAVKHSGNEATAILHAATDAVIADHVHLIGPPDDAGLARAWPAADAHIFPVRNDPDDPEGFGMAALEAAAWSVPTIAFSTGGIPDAVAEGASGHLVSPHDYAAFAAATIKTVRQREAYAKPARAFAERHAWPRFNDQLLHLLNDL